VVVRASLLVETESQKGIVVGRGGGMIRDIGASARSALSRLWGTEVHMDLTVRVRKRWRDDESMLQRLGL
jgi:GTP-binding protein Era